MALNKKKSRRITVNSEVFRYVISGSQGSEEGWYMLDIVAQHEESNGSKLYASGIPTKGDYWFAVSKQTNPEPDDYPFITPKLVAETIERAMDDGWRYLEPGKNYKLTMHA